MANSSATRSGGLYNAIELPKVAEARLAYGGRGTLTNIQTERWGQQVADIILPF